MSFSVGSLADLIAGSASGKKKKPAGALAEVFGASSQQVQFKQVPAQSHPHGREVDSEAKQKRKLEAESQEFPRKAGRFQNEWASFPESVEDYGQWSGQSTRPPRKKKIPRDPEQEWRTVFVGNLPMKTKKKKLKQLFQEFGLIEAVRFRCAAVPDSKTSKKVAVIKRDFHSDRSSIAAYVRFASREAAEAALKINGTLLGEHYLRVDLADSSANYDNKKAVFVGNLPFAVEENDLWEFFKECGKISCVRVIRDSKSGIGMGCGFVNFESNDSVELALQLSGHELKKRALVIERYARKPKPKVAVVIPKRSGRKMTDDSHESPKKKGWRERDGEKVVFKKVNAKKQQREAQSRPYHGQEARSEGKKKKKAKVNKDEKKKKKVAKLLQKSYKSVVIG